MDGDVLYSCPLLIEIYDPLFNLKQTLMDSVPTSLTGSVDVNTSGLVPGHYLILFQMGNKIKGDVLIKQ